MAGNSDSPVRPKRVTAQMVADLAGVSRSAVSRALNGGGYVDAQKREQIVKAAAELGYQPNALAATLQGGASRLVAVVAGDIRNLHDSNFVFRLCEGLNRQGFWPLVITGTQTASGITVEDALRFPLDAIVVRGGSMTEALVDRCGKLNIPMICYGRSIENAKADAVCCENAAGTRKATELLLAKGRKKFGFISGPQGFFSSDQRRRGLIETLDQAGLSLSFEHPGDFTVDGGFAAAQAMIASGETIDALICANDASAIGALGALRSCNIDVPSQMSVIGFDDAEMARWPMFALTTVQNPIDLMVETILDLIQRRITAPERPAKTVTVMPEILLRETH
ncbi:MULTISPECIES: LacI family DNA-binding transcriptional regulator [unclassified Ruegeria]|uniref:LacI family DNA-binding transcriptional regulator n=1 Tax=unclassified Ruegeria TaxID=2625375 RepID=UPI001488FE91|nr:MULTISPECIES: LacI family DNA-binding transcriptional regulator [unclassified Ruegeria]